MSAEPIATLTEAQSAWRTPSSCQAASYHPVVKPTNGSAAMTESLNEKTMRTIVGA